ncbi:unnamed protein product [Scytosiphon promiscuus]
MADPVGLVLSVLGVFGSACEAAESARNFPPSLEDRLAYAKSVLEQLQRDPRQVELIGIEHELTQLKGLADRIKALVEEHTAAPTDACCERVCKAISRCSRHREHEKELQEIDNDMQRALGAIAAKGVTGHLLPPPLPEMAAVPAGALTLPRSYVERQSVQATVKSLIDPNNALSPFTVVGMGGGGKTVLASAVVRKSSVREHFQGGVFWIRVGKGGKNNLPSLLQGLAREMGAAPTDTPHGLPQVFHTLKQAERHLITVASKETSRRLVVLDDVWEREVVDTVLVLGLKVLVTTRDRSVVSALGGYLEVGDMTQDEAMQLLLKTSFTVGQPGEEARAQMAKVFARCGRLPMVLAIAGSMSVVKGKGLTAGAWEELTKLFKNAATMMWESGEESISLDAVLGASFNALGARKREEFLRMAVLASGAVAPIEMLRNLWEVEDLQGAEEEAESFVGKCLLQDAGGGAYRVHDLLLEYVKVKIKADGERVKKAAKLQAWYLGRLDVVRGYEDPEQGAGGKGLFALDALWRSAEALSGDPGLQVASYSASLGELEACKATEEAASAFACVGHLFDLQGKFDHAERLYVKAIAVGEEALGRDHQSIAVWVNNRAELLRTQGKYAEAEPLYERCRTITEQALGPEHPMFAKMLKNWAGMLKSLGKHEKADLLYVRAIEIEEKTLGPDHPDLAVSLNNRAGLLKAQGKYEEAGVLYDTTQKIFEKSLGQDHPKVAIVVNNRAALLQSQDKYTEAGALHRRAIEIGEASLGFDHPDLAASLKQWACLFGSLGENAGSKPRMRRSLHAEEIAVSSESVVAALLRKRAGSLEVQRCV